MPITHAIMRWVKKLIGFPTTHTPCQPEYGYGEIVHLPSIGHSLTNPTGPSWTLLPEKNSPETVSGMGKTSQTHRLSLVARSVVKFIGHIITCRMYGFTT
jgi:hypothetical protein